MSNDVLTVGDYFAAFKRRKLLLMATMFFVVLGATTLAFVWPPTYYSSGTILVEQQNVPEALVQSTISTYANERIQIVSKRVMTSGNLVEIIEKFDLYPEERAAGVRSEQLVNRFREDTVLETLSAEVSNRLGRTVQSTIAFTVGYNSASPETARDVAAELVELYLSENARSRTQAATETSAFLQRRAQTLDSELRDLEQQLADFKEVHGDSLPELQGLNRDRLDTADREGDNLQREIRSLKDARDLVESELSVISPYASYDSPDGLMTAPQRLDILQREYITLTSKYGPRHPDLIRLRKEIALLTGGNFDTELQAIEERLYAFRLELAPLKERYAADHPDVVTKERQIRELEQRRERLLKDSTKNLKPTNPIFIQKQGQLTATRNELATAERQLAALIERRQEYEQRLMRSPIVERDYTALQREYDAKLAQFREVEDKREAARLSESLEVEQKGERFAMIDAPRVPQEPISPNRIAIILLGIVVAVGGGVGLASLVDAMDTTVRGSKDIADLFDTPPIATIMYVENPADVMKRRARNMLIAGGALASIAAVAVMVQLAG